MASGILIVPILTVFANLDVHSAIGASLISLIACSCASAGPFLNARLTDVRLALVLETATVLGGTCGLLCAGVLSPRALCLIFASVLMVSAHQLFAGSRDSGLKVGSAGQVINATPHAGYPHLTRHLQTAYRERQLPFSLLSMFCAGLLSSLVGIASGVLKVPAMDATLHLPIKVSTATSSFMIGVAATAGAATYWLRGDLQPVIVAPIALGSVLGTVLGVKGLLHISDHRLRLALAAALTALALQMILIGLGVSAGRPL